MKIFGGGPLSRQRFGSSSKRVCLPLSGTSPPFPFFFQGWNGGAGGLLGALIPSCLGEIVVAQLVEGLSSLAIKKTTGIWLNSRK